MLFDCAPNHDSRPGVCIAMVPPHSPSGPSYSYWVQAHSAPDASEEEEVARFLMTATFGSPRSDIDAFPAAPAGSSGGIQDRAMEWIRNQI